MKNTDLVLEEIYNAIHNGHEYIFIMKGVEGDDGVNLGHFIIIRDGYYSTGSSGFGNSTIYRPATEHEKECLQNCINAGKFVPAPINKEDYSLTY